MKAVTGGLAEAVRGEAIDALVSTVLEKIAAYSAGRDKLRERLAVLSHTIWSEFVRNELEDGVTTLPGGEWLIPTEWVNHWKTLAHAPYGELPAYLKHYSRQDADRYIALLEELAKGGQG